MSDDEKIAVEIVAFERVEYRQTIHIPKREFDFLMGLYNDEDTDEEDAAEQILDWVDRTDVCGSDNPEVICFRRAE